MCTRQHKALFGSSNILHFCPPLSACLTKCPLPSSHRSASGWSTLAPDDSEVVANMQAYLRSLLQQSPSSQSRLQQELPTTTSTDSQGWSIPQRTLVRAGFVSVWSGTAGSCNMPLQRHLLLAAAGLGGTATGAHPCCERCDGHNELCIRQTCEWTHGRTHGWGEGVVLSDGGWEQCCWRRTALTRRQVTFTRCPPALHGDDTHHQAAGMLTGRPVVCRGCAGHAARC